MVLIFVPGLADGGSDPSALITIVVIFLRQLWNDAAFPHCCCDEKVYIPAIPSTPPQSLVSPAVDYAALTRSAANRSKTETSQEAMDMRASETLAQSWTAASAR